MVIKIDGLKEVIDEKKDEEKQEGERIIKKIDESIKRKCRGDSEADYIEQCFFIEERFIPSKTVQEYIRQEYEKAGWEVLTLDFRYEKRDGLDSPWCAIMLATPEKYQEIEKERQRESERKRKEEQEVKKRNKKWKRFVVIGIILYFSCFLVVPLLSCLLLVLIQ